MRTGIAPAFQPLRPPVAEGDGRRAPRRL